MSTWLEWGQPDLVRDGLDLAQLEMDLNRLEPRWAWPYLVQGGFELTRFEVSPIELYTIWYGLVMT